MTKTPTNKANNGKDKLSSQVSQTDNFQSFCSPKTDSHLKIAGEPEGKLIKIETKSPNKNSNKSVFNKLKAKTAAALVSSVVMLPILAVGTATYYFGGQAVEKQIILAKRSDNIGLAETELARQQKLLAALLIGTGTTALLAGAIAALVTKRLFDSMSKTSQKEFVEEANSQIYKEFIDNLSQSIPQKDILKAIVEEARTYLNCDRVVVYSLNKDKYGTIIAESVVLNHTQWLGITIEDPCFEARYLDKYRNGRVRAINDINKVEMTPCHKEQLEAMEVKANLVTPIVNEGMLFGLLVAHQCDRPREWQEGEIEFLH